MERIRNLDRYQKALLAALLVMAVVFAAVYGVVTGRVGLLYHDTILVHSRQGDTDLYTGKLDGLESVFTVSADTVTFRWGEKDYGPYILREDPTAIPAGHKYAELMTGLEILDGEKIFFRGGWLSGGADILYHENGEVEHGIFITTRPSADAYAPTVWTILRLLEGPELTHKGHWIAYLMCLLLSGALAVSMLFADELFRFRMSFRVQDSYSIEPSDWEVASRYIGWTILSVMILVLYFKGLQ